jgi:sphingolipid delta-4 desaturase
MCAHFLGSLQHVLTSLQVGYHNEHHDFPSIPWTRLPALRKLAPEFYDTLPSHPSWPMILINFVRDENVGIYARIKRQPRTAKKYVPPNIELDGGCADVNDRTGEQRRTD